MNQTGVDQAAFRGAMSRFPAGVTIVTTTDAQQTPWGFTASSFCSLSLDPPLILVCLAREARCFEAFRGAASYVVHIAAQQHRDLALHFASKKVDDKFAGMPFVTGASGHPELRDAVATLRCRSENVVPAGDHVILVGRVVDLEVRDEAVPLVHGDRQFWQLAAHEA
jgi:flavin reductase ActVB